jgi:hypothetical protein
MLIPIGRDATELAKSVALKADLLWKIGADNQTRIGLVDRHVAYVGQASEPHSLSQIGAVHCVRRRSAI